MQFQVITNYDKKDPAPYKLGYYAGSCWRQIGSFDNRDHAFEYCLNLNSQEPSALELVEGSKNERK